MVQESTQYGFYSKIIHRNRVYLCYLQLNVYKKKLFKVQWGFMFTCLWPGQYRIRCLLPPLPSPPRPCLLSFSVCLSCSRSCLIASSSLAGGDGRGAAASRLFEFPPFLLVLLVVVVAVEFFPSFQLIKQVFEYDDVIFKTGGQLMKAQQHSIIQQDMDPLQLCS